MCYTNQVGDIILEARGYLGGGGGNSPILNSVE